MTDDGDSTKSAESRTAVDDMSGQIGTASSWLKGISNQYKKSDARYNKMDGFLHGLLSKFSIREYLYMTVFFSSLLYSFDARAKIGEAIYLTAVVTATSVIFLEMAHFLSRRSSPYIVKLYAHLRKGHSNNVPEAVPLHEDTQQSKTASSQ